MSYAVDLHPDESVKGHAKHHSIQRWMAKGPWDFTPRSLQNMLGGRHPSASEPQSGIGHIVLL